MSRLDELEFEHNPDPRCPCVLLLDTSGSMAGAPIEALNRGISIFYEDVRKDDLASQRVEVAIVTFGNGGVQKVQDFTTLGDRGEVAESVEPPILLAGGNTPMGSAINPGFEMLRQRKDSYNKNGVPSYRPWMLLITDGVPTDYWQAATQHVHQEEQSKGVIFFAIGVGEEADMQILSQISVRPPLMLQGLKFKELFLWLSRSTKNVSASKPGDKVGLPPIDDWSMVSV